LPTIIEKTYYNLIIEETVIQSATTERDDLVLISPGVIPRPLGRKILAKLIMANTRLRVQRESRA
jgi:hypothetical protein